jgi:ribose transport system substrate-binding protein
MKLRTFVAPLLAAGLAMSSGASLVAADSVKIGVVLKTMSSQYWKIMAAGIKTAAKEHNVNLILLGPPSENDHEQQINMVQDVLSQKPAVLIFSPQQPTVAVNVLLKAKAQGVPVILVDTGMPASFTDYATFIGTDNLSAGRLGGQALAGLLKKGDKVILLDGTPGNLAMNDRIKGAAAVLEAAGMVIAARQPAYSDREKAYSVTQNILQAHPDIAGVFTGSDETAMGASRALLQSGHKAPVISVDGDHDALVSILAGDMYGTVAQANYEMGRLAVERALDLVAGKTVPKRIDSGATLTTRANAQKLLDFQAAIK